MKKNTFISILFLSLFCTLLSACGQKGPLYLPEKKSQVEIPKPQISKENTQSPVSSSSTNSSIKENH